MHDDYDEDSFIEVDKEDVHEEHEYEILFYRVLTGSDNFEIVPLPNIYGENLTQKELRQIESQCKAEGIALVYRVSHGTKVATIFNSKTMVTGVVPEDSNEGFFC